MTQVDILNERIKALHITNIGFTLGTNPNVTAEDIARLINRALDAIERGDYEEV